MASDSSPLDRRRFRRVRAPIAVRPVSFLARAVPRRVSDASQGGLRAYSDEPRKVGERLELELFFPDGTGATVLAAVVWVESLPDGGPAHYDVGVRFVDASPADQARIASALQEG
jgi:hypothetical protein